MAHLPVTWAQAWTAALVEAGVRQVTTIENEVPFLAYVEESGGPAGLGARGEIAVYTAGFPDPALTAALASLAARSTGISFRHWGDADVGGLRIWWFLRSRLARPLDIFRTTSGWIAAESSGGGGTELSAPERAALGRMRDELAEISGEDVDAAREAIGAMLEHGVKLEQERY